VDALRADALDPASPGFAMPETAAWAEGCVRVREARTAATFTDLSLVALWTGMHPRHLLRDGQLTMAKGDPQKGRLPVPPTLAAALQKAGWRSAAVVTFDPVRPYIVAGFDQVLSSGRPEVQAPRAPEVLDAARRAFDDLSGGPRLLWAHLMDPHAPYEGGEDREAYLREVRTLDAPLAAFLTSLPHDAIVVLTADHGEAFGEHGHYTHGNTLFDEEVRVPLVLCAPEGALGPPRDVDTPVSLVDVTPTLLDLAGASAPYPRHGESLVRPLRDGAELRSAWVLFEVWLPHAHAQGVLLGCDVWLRDLDREWEALFDRCDDPEQTQDLLSERAVVAQRLRELFLTALDLDLDAFRSWRM
jgi:arylsulfatase A-like enzyme